MNENPKLVPFKIEHLYGNRLENVKRFYIDLDKDVLFERQSNGNTSINPWAFGIEYEYSPLNTQ